MFEQLQKVLMNAWLNFRPADLLDIAFVAVALYFVISWVRRQASAAVAIGVSVLLGAYMVAEALDLYMTTFLFQVGLTVIVFGFLLVFQDDIRRVFERLRIRAMGRKTQQTAREAYLDDIIEAVSNMADRYVGALIVLEGEESIDVHTHGGVKLDGQVTTPLLLSLFQPKSPAHDGAVTIRDGQIEKFGVHLPLSTDERQLGERGTRHAAALGMSERCDATMIVVSEERGVISIARDGRLEEVESSELKTRLGKLYGDEQPRRPNVWQRVVRENAGFKALSVVIATLLWLTFASRTSTFHRSYVIPVEFQNVPKNLAVERIEPNEVKVELLGPQRAFDQLAPERLAVSLNLAGEKAGESTVVLSEDLLDLPGEISVATFEPPQVGVGLYELSPKTLSVAVRTEGQLPKELELVKLAPDPAAVEVLVRRTRRDEVDRLETKPISLSKMRKTTTVETALIPNPHVRWKEGFDGKVSVRVHVRQTEKPSDQPGG